MVRQRANTKRKQEEARKLEAARKAAYERDQQLKYKREREAKYGKSRYSPSTRSAFSNIRNVHNRSMNRLRGVASRYSSGRISSSGVHRATRSIRRTHRSAMRRISRAHSSAMSRSSYPRPPSPRVRSFFSL